MPRHTRREMLTAAAALFTERLGALPLSQFALGVTTDEIDDDVLTAAKFLKRYDLKWAEVRNIWGPYNTEQPMEKIRQARGIFDEQGIRISVLDTGFFKVPLPPDTPEGRKKLEEQWALLDRSLERARAFGTRKLRVFTFMLDRGENPSERSYERIYELVTEAARRARGFRLAIEISAGDTLPPARSRACC